MTLDSNNADDDVSSYLCSLRGLWISLFAISCCLTLLMAFLFPSIEPGTGSYVVGMVNIGILSTVAVGTMGLLIWCRIYERRNRESI